MFSALLIAILTCAKAVLPIGRSLLVLVYPIISPKIRSNYLRIQRKFVILVKLTKLMATRRDSSVGRAED